MSWFDLSLILIGIIGGNLAAAVIRPCNLGLWWNSVIGGAAAIVLIKVMQAFSLSFFGYWAYDFVAAGLVSLAAVTIAGAVAALFYRD